MKLPKFVGLYLLLWGKGKDEQLSIELMIPQFDKAGKRLNHTYTCPKTDHFVLVYLRHHHQFIKNGKYMSLLGTPTTQNFPESHTDRNGRNIS